MIRYIYNYACEAYDMPLSNSWLQAITFLTTVMTFVMLIYGARVFRRKVRKATDLEARLTTAVENVETVLSNMTELSIRLETDIRLVEKVTTEAYSVLNLAARNQDLAAAQRKDVIDEVKGIKKTAALVVEKVEQVVGSASGVIKKEDMASPTSPKT